MRIGIDTTALPQNPVGAGRYIIELTRALSEINQEHEFVLFAQPHGQELISTPSSSNFRWRITSPMSPGRRLIWEQCVLPVLARQEKLDVLHSPHYTRPAILPSRSVVTFHDMSFLLYPQLHTPAKRLFFPLMMRYSARWADAIIAVSERTRQEAIQLLNIPEEKITTALHGIHKIYRPIRDKDALEACRARYNLPDKFLLYVGTIEPRKNLSLLFDAYHQALEHGLEYSLVVVGALGWMVGETLNKVETLGLKDKIIFTGYIPQDDLPKIYNLAHIFIYPALYEGFGLPPLEAMACGTPVITSNTSPIKEHIGDAGLLVNPENVDEMVRAIIQLARNRALHENLSEKGKIRAEKFTWKQTAERTLTVYQKVGSKKK